MPEFLSRGFIIRNRWWFFTATLLGMMVFELHEHPGVLLGGMDATLVFELMLYAILVGLALFLVELLLRTVNARDQVMDLLNKQHQFVLQLSAAHNWAEFCQRVLEFPNSVASFQNIDLLILDEQTGHYTTGASWPSQVADGARPDRATDAESILELCTESQGGQKSGVYALSTCELLHSPSVPGVYCLALRYGERVTGMVHLRLAGGQALTLVQRQLLSSVGVEIAAVMEAFRQRTRRALAEASDAARAERLAIAQDMHDTIGQNLCYLRLKLDQMAMPGGLYKISDPRQELEQLRDQADESYELVRGSLAILQLENTPQFINLLRTQGTLSAERAGFQFSLDSQGEPLALAPEVMRHAFYVCKEALNNIEKHAQASEVSFQLHWNDTGVEVTIVDDGIGFEASAPVAGDHYGLEIMCKRVEAAHGRFCLKSSPGDGTRVQFWLPYAQDQPVMEVVRA